MNGMGLKVNILGKRYGSVWFTVQSRQCLHELLPVGGLEL